VAHNIVRAQSGEWTVDGSPAPHLTGCEDIDLGFSPSTNLLPVRRLELPIGASMAVRAAWVRFPEFTTEVLEQVYTRLGQGRYHYESAGGRFQRDLVVDATGFVLDYPELWIAEARTTNSQPNDG
jgi:uncharacterized protein